MGIREILTQEEINALLRISTAPKRLNNLTKKKSQFKTKNKLPHQGITIDLLLRSTLVSKTTTLEDYLNWQVGDFLELGTLPKITLEVASTPIFTATLEKSIDKRALKLSARIHYEKE